MSHPAAVIYRAIQTRPEAEVHEIVRRISVLLHVGYGSCPVAPSTYYHGGLGYRKVRLNNQYLLIPLLYWLCCLERNLVSKICESNFYLSNASAFDALPFSPLRAETGCLTGGVFWEMASEKPRV